MAITTYRISRFSAPLNGATRGQLVFSPGATNIEFRVDADMPDLFRARFEGAAPEVEVEDGRVDVRYPRRGFAGVLFGWRGRSEGEVVLNPAVPWSIESRGGANRLEGDLSALRLESIRFAGGANRIDLELPRPGGEVRIRCSGGANRVRLRRPPGTAIRLEIRGGANRVMFDGEVLPPGRGGAVQSNGYDIARDRYTFSIAGGANRIEIASTWVDPSDLPFF